MCVSVQPPTTCLLSLVWVGVSGCESPYRYATSHASVRVSVVGVTASCSTPFCHLRVRFIADTSQMMQALLLSRVKSDAYGYTRVTAACLWIALNVYHM